jgi:hypothetical protein
MFNSLSEVKVAWLQWGNPVAIWWVTLTSVSLVNILVWFWVRKYLSQNNLAIKWLTWLSGAYVFGCAFRSVLPRADVQRICLFDTWWSSVLVGRTVATLAEMAFVAQWAIVIYALAVAHDTDWSKLVARIILPIIFVAECFSWYAVITTNYLGNTIEESLWAFTYLLIMTAIIGLRPKLTGALKLGCNFAIVGCVLYILFMVAVDVPMYFNRWQADLAAGKETFGFLAGLNDLNTRWVVTHDITEWRTEIPWMSLYFSVAVWISLALCFVLKRTRPGG